MNPYKHLIGRPLEYHEAGGATTPAIVAAIDFEVGATIVQESDPENKLVCLNKAIHSDLAVPYDEIFRDLVADIECGHRFANGQERYYPEPTRSNTLSCAFE